MDVHPGHGMTRDTTHNEVLASWGGFESHRPMPSLRRESIGDVCGKGVGKRGLARRDGDRRLVPDHERRVRDDVVVPEGDAHRPAHRYRDRLITLGAAVEVEAPVRARRSGDERDGHCLRAGIVRHVLVDGSGIGGRGRRRDHRCDNESEREADHESHSSTRAGGIAAAAMAHGWRSTFRGEQGARPCPPSATMVWAQEANTNHRV